MKKYHQAYVVFNGGEGALLCNACRTIIAYGFEHEDKMHMCDKCKLEIPEEQDKCLGVGKCQDQGCPAYYASEEQE